MIPNERPTPITDAVLLNICGHTDIVEICGHTDIVEADFARTLERSLAERTEERDELVERFRKEIKKRQETQRANAIIDAQILAEVTAERDALKHALIELEAAAEAYAADQSRATDSRCGLVQPITVEDGNRLLSALKAANELTK